MPMQFPNMRSLEIAAKVHKFRQPKEGESEEHFRRVLSEHVFFNDKIEAMEIRTGKGWDEFTEDDNRKMVNWAISKSDETMIEERYCGRCDEDTEHTIKEIKERWMDTSIPDDELSQSEVISRANGDVTSRVTCTICNHGFDEM